MGTNIKKVLLPEPRYLEIKRKGITDTATYRYCIWRNEGDGRECVKRIRLEYLGTTAVLSAASDVNPNGWQAVKVEMKK